MSVIQIKQLAEDFRTVIKQSTGIVLEYTEPSVAMLDKIIDTFVVGKTPEFIDRTAQYLGAFLGEVLVVNYGMHWMQRAEDGQWVVTVKSKKGHDITTNPWNKIFKRIDNGPEDSLAYYFAMIHKAINDELV